MLRYSRLNNPLFQPDNLCSRHTSSAHSFAYAASTKCVRRSIRRGRQNMQWWQSSLAVWYRCAQSSQPDMCQYRRFRVAITSPGILTWHSRLRAAFLKSAMFLLAASRNHFLSTRLAVYPRVLVFRMASAQVYAYDDLVLLDVSVHDTNKRCSHYASCLSAAAGTRSSAE